MAENFRFGFFRFLVTFVTKSTYGPGEDLDVRVNILKKTPSLAFAGDVAKTNSRRADALLLFLCLSKEAVHSRETLACLLWEDTAPEQSLGSLRQLIHRIRSKVPGVENVVEFGRIQVSVDHSKIETDLAAFTAKLRDLEGALPEDLSLQLSDLFQPFIGLSDGFDGWIAYISNKIEAELRAALNEVLRRENIENSRRMFAAQNLYALDGTDEHAGRVLMRHHAISGNQAAAIQIYDDLHERLDRDHDTLPADETIDLIVKIKTGDLADLTEPSNIRQSRPYQALPSIFIPEFTILGESKPLESLAGVFRHELFINLTTYREWHLYDVQPAHDDCYVFEGSLMRVGDDVQFRTSLKQHPLGQVLWTGILNIEYYNWENVQNAIAKRLSLELNREFSVDRLKRNRGKGLKSKKAYDSWMHAQSLVMEWDPEKDKEAMGQLEFVISEAPDFCPALASRANIEATLHLSAPGLVRSEHRTKSALDYAKQALRADPLDNRAHLAMGWALSMRDQHDASLVHFETCRELNPCSPLSNLACALGFAFAGQSERASQMTDEAESLVQDLPEYLWGYVQNIRFLAGDLDRALQAGERAKNAIANLPGWHVTALVEADRLDEASKYAKTFRNSAKSSWAVETDFDDKALAMWFAGCFPLKDPAQTQRLQRGLETALAV